MRKIDLKSATLVSLMGYLEELDFEASTLNKSTSELLERDKLNKKITKDIFIVLNNTLQAMKKGEITCNGESVKPFEHDEERHDYILYGIPLEDAYKPKSTKDLGGWLDNREDFDITGFSTLGANFVSNNPDEKGDGFAYDVKNGKIYLVNNNVAIGYSMYWKFGEDFTHVLHVPNQGIYLLKEVNKVLEGVTWIRW